MSSMMSIAAACWLGTVGPVALLGQSGSPAPQVHDAAPADKAVLDVFRLEVQEYAAFRLELTNELAPLVAGSTSTVINQRSDALARAVQRARPKARRGDFFTPAVAALIRRRLHNISDDDRERLLSVVNPEPVLTRSPRVYMRFPAGEPVATMPTVVLDLLPPLPVELEFRFVGRDLVLRDRDAALILDYIPKAFPLPGSR